MSIAILIVSSIILYFFYQYICAKYMLQDQKPPKSVRAAGIAEVVFGMLVLSPMWFIQDNQLFLVFFQVLCLFWICIAISLYKASKIGRTICLILSIVRIPTIIGIPFSIFSLYQLYFTQESKIFFKINNEKKPCSVTAESMKL
jgi:hypothetical protein